MSEKMLDPKMDLVFKTLFCLPENNQALIQFLNTMFADKDLPIVKNVKVLEPNVADRLVHSNLIMLELEAKSMENEPIEIQIQKHKHRGFWSSSMHNISEEQTHFISHLISGSYKMKRTIWILITEFEIGNNDDFHSVYTFKDSKNGHTLTDKLETHILELPKLANVEVEHSADRPLRNWVSFLNGAAQEEWARLSADDSELQRIMNTLVSISSDTNMSTLANAREKVLNVQSYLYETGYKEGKSR